MREILFRGKRTDNGEWVQGYYSPANIPLVGCLGHFINVGGYEAIEIEPETVGQYTGLTDKNGIKIFEGDIVKGTFLGFPIPIEDDVFSICWQEDVAGYKANYFENVEVIGNIYDNPKLLETNK